MFRYIFRIIRAVAESIGFYYDATQTFNWLDGGSVITASVIVPSSEAIFNVPLLVIGVVLILFAIVRMIFRYMKWLKTKVSIRELEILILHSEGKENEEIAEILDIKYQTVKNMLHSLIKKLEASNNAQSLMRAISDSLVKVNIDNKDERDLAEKIRWAIESEASKENPRDDMEYIYNGIKKILRRKS